MDFGKRLTELRQLKKLSQVEVASSLGIAKSTYHGYENNKREPDIQKIRAICKLLDVSSDELLELKDIQVHHTDEELDILKKLSALDVSGRQFISSIIDLELSRGSAKASSINSDYIYLDVLPSSPAENAQDAYSPALKVKNTSISKKSDFVIRMSGESMLPRFFDGESMLIKSQNELQNGDYGVFNVNGKYYVRQYGGDRLIALNTEYRDIFVSECEIFQIIGKVLGKL